MGKLTTKPKTNMQYSIPALTTAIAAAISNIQTAQAALKTSNLAAITAGVPMLADYVAGTGKAPIIKVQKANFKPKMAQLTAFNANLALLSGTTVDLNEDDVTELLDIGTGEVTERTLEITQVCGSRS